MALPLPRVVADVGPGGPLVTSMRGMNALTASNLENQIKKVEAEYAPWTNYANALSKMAYSQFLGPQTTAKMLTDPATRGLFTPEQQAQLAKAYMAQNYNGVNSALSNIPTPDKFNRSGGGLINLVRSFFSPSQSQAPSNNAFQGMPMPSNQGGRPMNQLPVNPPVSNAVAPPGSTIGYNTPASQQAQGLQIPGTVGAANPAAATQRNEKAAEVGAVGQTATQNALWQNVQEKASTNTQVATDLHNALDQFHTNFKEATIKGPGTQRFNPYGLVAGVLNAAGLDVTPEQLASTAKTDMVTLLAPLRQKGHVTDANMELFSGIKLDPAMTDKAEKVMYDSMSSSIERMQEYQDFISFIRRQNPDIQENEAESLWRYYNRQYPPYDKVKQKPNPQYVDKWDIFASPQALQQFRQTGRFKAPEIKGNVKIYNHPKLGKVTEEDIDREVKRYNKTRQEVIKDLGLE